MPEQDLAALLDILKQTNHTLQKGFEQNAERQGEINNILNDRLNEIFDTQHDIYTVLREVAGSLKIISREMKDGGLAHDICMGVRCGIFGKNAKDHSTVCDLVDPLKNVLEAIGEAIEDGKEKI